MLKINSGWSCRAYVLRACKIEIAVDCLRVWSNGTWSAQRRRIWKSQLRVSPGKRSPLSISYHKIFCTTGVQQPLHNSNYLFPCSRVSNRGTMKQKINKLFFFCIIQAFTVSTFAPGFTLCLTRSPKLWLASWVIVHLAFLQHLMPYSSDLLTKAYNVHTYRQ